MPLQAPCGIEAGTPCRLGRHDVRERVTGPGFPLVLARCRAHRRAFTLYPPAYAPYARVAIAPAAPDAGVPAEQYAPRTDAFHGTLFAAAIDAAKGLAWPREHVGGDQRWWHTQQRQLDMALDVLGLQPGANENLRHSIAETLAIDALTLVELSIALQGPTIGYRARGRAVTAVLDRLAPASLLADRLLEAGHLAGRWGAPHRFVPGSSVLLRCPFRTAGMPRARPPP
jgi:hypothetical protein